MDERLLASAQRLSCSILQGNHNRALFRQSLLDVPFLDRDAFVDAVFGLDELPEDGPELPHGCVPYLPCSVDALLRIADQLPVNADDVFVDIGSGVGRAAVLMHLLTGARVIGIEVQSRLVEFARQLANRMHLSNVTFVQGDVLEQANVSSQGTVFFLYCPFSGERLGRFLRELETFARERSIRVCTVDLPLPQQNWLVRRAAEGTDLEMYSSIA